MVGNHSDVRIAEGGDFCIVCFGNNGDMVMNNVGEMWV